MGLKLSYKCPYFGKPCEHAYHNRCVRYLSKGVPDTDFKTYCDSKED